MKHLLLILVVSIGAYALWNMSPPDDRRKTAAFVSRHATRIILIVLVILVLVSVSILFPAVSFV